jgi:hypothetical protein
LAEDKWRERFTHRNEDRTSCGGCEMNLVIQDNNGNRIVLMAEDCSIKVLGTNEAPPAPFTTCHTFAVRAVVFKTLDTASEDLNPRQLLCVECGLCSNHCREFGGVFVPGQSGECWHSSHVEPAP